MAQMGSLEGAEVSPEHPHANKAVSLEQQRFLNELCGALGVREADVNMAMGTSDDDEGSSFYSGSDTGDDGSADEPVASGAYASGWPLLSHTAPLTCTTCTAKHRPGPSPA